MSEAEETGRRLALCTVGECKQNALYSYTWDWGETGFSCARCTVSLQHRMQAVGRTCTFVALQPGAPIELGKDERIQLHARVLAAQDEVRVVKARNLQLFDANQVLSAETRQLRAELEQFQAQLADARAEADQLTAEKMKALQQLAETNHELARLQGLLEAADASP